MRSPLATRIAASALAIVVLGGAAGCAADPGASNPVPTSTATSTPDTTPSPTPSETPTSEPSPTSEPTESPAPGYGAFTFEQLAQICIDVTVSAYAPDVVFDAESTRIEMRTVAPQWLVLVPVTTSGYQGQSVCTIDGSPDDPQIELSSGSIEQLPEEQIQRLIRGENEGGDR